MLYGLSKKSVAAMPSLTALVYVPLVAVMLLAIILLTRKGTL